MLNKLLISLVIWNFSLILCAESSARITDTFLLSDKAASYLTDENDLNVFEDERNWVRTSSNEGINLGFTDKTYWARFNISGNDPTDSVPEPFILEFTYPLLDYLDLYFPTKSGELIQKKSGDRNGITDREVSHHNLVFKTPKQWNGQYVLAKFSSSGPVILPLKVWDVASWVEQNTLSSIGFGIYFGIMIALIAYNFFLWIQFRSISYVYYISYTMFFALYLGSSTGITTQYLWPQWEGWANDSYLFSINVSCVALAAFSNLFLNSHLNQSLFAKTLKVFTGYFAVASVCVFLMDYALIARITTVSTIPFAMILVSNSVYRLVQNFIPARFFLLAFVVLIFGSVLYALRALGILESNFVTSNGTLIGSALEAILLSIALGDKVNYEKRKIMKKVKSLNSSLTHINQNLEEIVKNKTENIKGILHSIKQGIFTVSRNENDKVVIDDEFSPQIAEIVGESFEPGSDPTMSIFAKSDLTKESCDVIQSVLDLSIGENILQWDSCAKNLPKTFKVNNKVVNCSFDPIVVDYVVTRVIVSLRDDTERIRLETMKADLQERERMFTEIFAIDEDDFVRFINTSEELLEECESKIGQESSKDKPQVETLRNLHTMKGLARSLKLDAISSMIHDIEDKLSERNPVSDQSLDRSKVEENFEKIHKVFDSYKAIAIDKLHIDFDDSKLRVPRSMLREWRFLLDSGKPPAQVSEKIARSMTMCFKETFEKLVNSLEPLTDVNLKPLPKLVYKESGGPFFVRPETVTDFQGIMIHLLRNSLDHGIEDSFERENLRKSTQGRITITAIADQSDESIFLTFCDDGRGLNVQKIMNQSTSSAVGESFHDIKSIAWSVFEDGLSTSDQVTEISGRGIGLAAVRQILLDHGGDIDIAIIDDRDLEKVDFEFQINLPRYFFEK